MLGATKLKKSTIVASVTTIWAMPLLISLSASFAMQRECSLTQHACPNEPYPNGRNAYQWRHSLLRVRFLAFGYRRTHSHILKGAALHQTAVFLGHLSHRYV